MLSNALKYTEAGEIKVKVSKEHVSGIGQDILVSIEDTGMGIDREEVGKLFSRFGQLTAGRMGAGLKSSGLGLYISKQIVEGWGGEIGVKSEGLGTGSTFFFTVPLTKNSQKGIISQGSTFSHEATKGIIN